MFRSLAHGGAPLAAAGLLALCACPSQSSADPPRPRPRDPTAEDYAAPPLDKGHVVIESAFGGKVAVEVEICRTPEQTQRGMMWRKELAPGKGMLFLFDEVTVHSFWMKNTLIPLDIIFIGPDMRVVGVVENAEPRTLSQRRVDAPSQHVLEVPGGWAAKTGIRTGVRMTFDLPR